MHSQLCDDHFAFVYNTRLAMCSISHIGIGDPISASNRCHADSWCPSVLLVQMAASQPVVMHIQVLGEFLA